MSEENGMTEEQKAEHIKNYIRSMKAAEDAMEPL